jgi:hypothetical protein
MPEGTRLQGRYARKGGNNIKIDSRGIIIWGGLDCIHRAQDRDQWQALVNTVMNIRVP